MHEDHAERKARLSLNSAGVDANVVPNRIGPGLNGSSGNNGSSGSSGSVGSPGLADDRVASPAAGGSGGSGGSPGHNGYPGGGGLYGQSSNTYGGTGGGGAGGSGGGGGGSGGNGGSGGYGGVGGEGADGSGGTIIINTTSFSGTATVNTERGWGIGYSEPGMRAGENGKFILGRSTSDAWTGSVTSGIEFTLNDGDGHNLGPRAANPFTANPADQTPYIPGLTDGADVCGMTGLSADGPELTGLFGDAPGGAVAALHLMDEGPAGLAQSWDGFDMLLMANLSSETLQIPQLGVDSQGHLVDLILGGWARSARFGGTGYEAMTALPGHGVYALLVPEGISHFNLDADGYDAAWAEVMNPGDNLYLVPEPAALMLMITGGALCLSRRRK